MAITIRRPTAAGRPVETAAASLRRVVPLALAVIGAAVLGLLSAQPMVAALVVVLAVVGVGAAVLFRSPALIVGIAVFSMWFDNFGAGPVRTGRVVVVLVTGLTALRILTSSWRPPALQLRAWVATAAFLLWAVVSGFWSLGIGTWAQGLFELLLGISYAAVFLIFLEDEPQLARAFKLFVWTGVPIALLSWFLYRGLQTTAKETGLENRTHGFTGNANVYAFVLMASVPIVVIFIRRAGHWLERLAYIGILGTLALALMASGSRSGLLAMGAMAMYCFVTVPGLDRRQRIRSAVAGTAFVAIGVLVAGIVNPERFSLAGFFNDAGAGRLELWNAAVRTFGLHPVQGSGIGGFRAQILDILTKVEGTLDITRNPVNRDAKDLEAHNLYLSLLLDLGIVGLVLWAVQYLTVARNLWDLRRSAWRDWAWAFGGTHLGLLVTASFGSSYNMKFSWTIIGFSGALFLRQLQPVPAVGRSLERAPVPSAVPPAPQPARTRGAAPMDLRLPVPFGRVLLAGVVGGAVLAGGASALFGRTHYATSAQVLVVNLDNNGDPRFGVQITDARIQTVLSIARSDPFLIEVKRQARLDQTIEEIAGMVDATRPGFSSVIRIDAASTDEAEAKRISRVLLGALDATVDQFRAGAISVMGEDGRPVSPDVAPEYRGPIYLRLWDTPRVQASPSRTTFAGVVGGVTGLFVVVFGAMLVHQRSRLSAREDVAGLLGVPFVAALPRTTGRRGRGRRRAVDATAYVRTAGDLLDAACANGARRVAVTGVHDRRLRAATSTSLALALATLGDRPVVLVDLDPVGRQLTRRLGARRARGWTDLADVGDRDLAAAVAALALPVPRRRLPRPLRRLGRHHLGQVRLLPVGRAGGTDHHEDRLAAVVAAAARDAVVIAHLGEVPGPLPLRHVVAACDTALITVLDGWTPTEPARVVAETLTAVAPGRVGYLLVEN